MIFEWIIGAIILLFGFVVFRGAPYVPSRTRYINEAFNELYPLDIRDTLVDIGSGDGVVLRQAARRGARAIGYELNPALVLISRLLSGGDKLVEVHLADAWFAEFPETTTVIYAFMVTRDMKKFVTKIQTEADRLQRPLAVMLYGNEIHDKTPTKVVGAYKLYGFVPKMRS
jgi:predicted RNA methylase